MTEMEAKWFIADDSYGSTYTRNGDEVSVDVSDQEILVTIKLGTYVDVPAGSTFKVVLRRQRQAMEWKKEKQNPA